MNKEQTIQKLEQEKIVVITRGIYDEACGGIVSGRYPLL